MLWWIPSLLSLIAAFAAIIIGFMVWFGERSNYLRIPFLWLTLFVAGWISSNVIFALIPSNYSFAVALASYATAMLVAVQTLYFCLRLIRYNPHRFARVLLGLGYISAIVSAIPGIVGVGVHDTTIMTRPLGIAVYGLILSAFLLMACIILIIKARRAGRVLRHQIKLILYGVAIASIIGIIFNLILPILGNYGYIQLGPAGATIFVGVIAYAVARYSLFDVRLAIVRGIAYLATFATLAGMYFVIAFFVANALKSPFLTSGQAALNISAALLMALLLQPIKKFFDKLTNKVFYRDNYDTDTFFAEINKALSSSNDLRTILKKTAYGIADNLKADQVLFFVYTSEGRYVTTGTDSHNTIPLQDIHTLNDYVNKLDTHREVIQASTFHDHDTMKRLMMSHRLELLLPLFREDTIVGYLCLGERRSGGYSRRDMRLLATVVDELLIAIQNALAVQEVRDLNEHLQQRIDAATKELRRSNAQLQKLDEAKDEFISMASHQLRTPLTSIKGYVSMLMEGDVGKVSSEQKHLLREAFMSSERMVRLIGDFLNVSRLQTGKFIIDKHPTDLVKLVAHEIDALEPNATARGMKFIYKQPKNIPELNLDENKIQQVVMNFADNAIYYSKENSIIKIELKLDKNAVEFVVKDTGIGVPNDEKSQLFGKFFRATNARKQRPDGTGVGLFLAKKVIDAHDGQIIFESREGKGSTFGFRLPIKKS